MLSTSGDTHLGGDDFDRRIVDYLAGDFQRSEGIDLRKDRQALQRLTEAAEKAKMELSTLSQARAPGLPHVSQDESAPLAREGVHCAHILPRVESRRRRPHASWGVEFEAEGSALCKLGRVAPPQQREVPSYQHNLSG